MKSASKVRILYIGPIPPEVGGKSTGGIATHCWQLATEAYKRGYEVYILANIASSFTKNGIKVISSPQRNKSLKALHGVRFWLTLNRNKVISLDFLSFKEKARVLYRAYFLQKTVNSVKPDLIHIHSLANMDVLSLGILKDCPSIVVTDHGIGVVYNYETFKEFDIKDRNHLQKKLREASRIASHIICVSDFSKDQLLRSFDFSNNKKIRAIPNPVDIDKLPLLSKKRNKRELGLGDKRVVLFSGVHNPMKKKGLDILLKAFSTNCYLRKNCNLLVLTEEETATFAQGYLEEKNIDGVVLEPQPWEKLVKYYNAADIFVLPSRTEGIGLVYEEALSTGVPVVGFPESVKELERLLGIYIGEKFDAGREDEKGLAEKIIKVLNIDFDRELLRRKAIKKLSWDAKFSEFKSVYKEVLQ